MTVFQTAVGLAEFDNARDKKDKVQLLKEHVTQVVELSQEFKTYLDDIFDKNEDARAYDSYLRQDPNADGDRGGKGDK
jgi:hypothetical protein